MSVMTVMLVGQDDVSDVSDVSVVSDVNEPPLPTPHYTRAPHFTHLAQWRSLFMSA